MFVTSGILVVLIILIAVVATYIHSQAVKKIHHHIQSLANFDLSYYRVFNQRNAIAIDEKNQQLCLYPNRPAPLMLPIKNIVKIELYRNSTQICQASPQQPLSQHTLEKIFTALTATENANKKVKSLSLHIETLNEPNNHIEIFMLHSIKGFKESVAITDLQQQAIKIFAAINGQFCSN